MKKTMVNLNKVGKTIRGLVSEGYTVVSARNTGKLDYPRLEITYR